MQDQQDYDRIASLIPNDQVANQFGTVQGNEKCKIVTLSRFVALPVSLIPKHHHCRPLQMTLLPAKLKAAGYEGHMIGKGHLGYQTTDHLPVNRGFQTHLGYLEAAEHYCEPSCFSSKQPRES